MGRVQAFSKVSKWAGADGGSSDIINPARGPRRGAVFARKGSEFSLEHAELGMHTGFSFISS